MKVRVKYDEEVAKFWHDGKLVVLLRITPAQLRTMYMGNTGEGELDIMSQPVVTPIPEDTSKMGWLDKLVVWIDGWFKS